MKAHIHNLLYRCIIHANVMGTFHTIANLYASNGKRYDYVGMRDICIVAGIIASRVEYPAYHMEECTIDQYNIGEMEGILPEADG